MIAKKWLAIWAVALATAAAQGQSRHFGDIRFTEVSFASSDKGDGHSDWGHGYLFAFYDVANTSHVLPHSVAFEYPANYRAPPIVL